MPYIVFLITVVLCVGPTYATSRPSRTNAVRINSARTPAAQSAPARSVTSRPTNIRAVVSRSGTIARTATAPTTADMDQLAELTEYCRAQYTACMDNFCNVLDDNQGRCSCSANLKNYSKTEDALKQATEDLQDVAQKIQYIGLTSDEVETLFKQTEAELAMQQNSDNTQLKNDLDRIKNMIVDVKSGTATTTDTGMSLDLSGLLDFSFSSTGFDLSSLFGGTNNTTSISNQRGADLYKTATARCKASVLNSCTAQGVDASVVTNAYDLEIDKQCIAYERNLTDTNTQMAQTVRNAKSVLQKARLLVAQQKNAYDLRGCINALDSCMQDDFVCGSDYENCLDPTGKYIVNGEIVVGSVPVAPTDAEISNYLRTKIGKLDNRGRPQGACAAVMQKCHNSVMKNDKYDTNNPLVTEYLARTVPRIQVLRANAIRAYGVSCVANVAACINQNGYGTSQNAAIQACMAHIKTCRSLTDSNTGTNLSDIRTWLATVMGPTNTTPDSPDIGDETNMRERDIANCLSIPGGRISTSGKLCVVWDADTNRTLTQKMINLAQQHGGQYYPGMPQSQSSYTGKQISGNVYAYIMRWAYLDALNECTQRDGTLTIPQGNAHIYCNIEFPVGKMTKTECDAMLTVWPGNGTFGGFNDSAVTVNGHVTKQNCRYTPAGFYYTGRDLPGTCLPGMTERNDNTGNCTCMPGYHYVTGFACEPDDGV